MLMSLYRGGKDILVIVSILVCQMYVAIDSNPENRAEIQNSACGRSGITMQIRTMKSMNNEENQKDDRDNLPHDTKVLKELVMSWANTDRIVCADSYFTSVTAAEELWKHGLHFIGVIKTSTQKFPMACLSKIEFQNRGDMSGLFTRPIDRTKLVLVASVWTDCTRQYFIFTGGLMDKGRPYTRT